MDIREYSTIASALNIAFIFWSFRVLFPAMTTDTYKGYIFSESSKVRFKHTRAQANALVTLWLLSSIFIILNIYSILACLISLCITYYFFIFLRYDSISRGFGAPGYFLTFANLISLCVQVVYKYQQSNFELVVSIVGFEIGTIFVVSGIYKCSSGYLVGKGINIGLNNPMWGYKPQYWRTWGSTQTRTKLINWISIFGEIFGGALLMSIKFQFAGAIVISLMFIGVMFMVRLGTLCPTIIFVTFGTNIISAPKMNESENMVNTFYFSFVAIILQAIIFLTYAGILFNFYRKNSLPIPLQKSVNLIQEFIGISLWRVFTSDITSIHIRVFNVNPDGNRLELSEWGRKRNRRFNFVGEAISVTSIFTLLKYQVSHEAFYSRLITYAKSFPHENIEFEFHYIESNSKMISERHVRTYLVNTTHSDVIEIRKDTSFNVSAPETHSRVTAATQYGHYN